MWKNQALNASQITLSLVCKECHSQVGQKEHRSVLLLLFVILLLLLGICIVAWYMYSVCTAPRRICEGQRTTLWSWVSPSNFPWVSGVTLRTPALCRQCLTCYSSLVPALSPPGAFATATLGKNFFFRSPWLSVSPTVVLGSWMPPAGAWHQDWFSECACSWLAVVVRVLVLWTDIMLKHVQTTTLADSIFPVLMRSSCSPCGSLSRPRYAPPMSTWVLPSVMSFAAFYCYP